MRRRNVLAGTGAAVAASILPRPSLAQPAGSRTLVFVPQGALASLDPIWTTATVTRNFAYVIYDTLYATDAQLRPQPQMAEGHTVDDDGKRWTIRLREGLRFHDDTPVLSRDCKASLLRWMKRDQLGSSIADRLEAMDTPDDRTLVIRLRQPFPPLAYALGKSQPSPAVIMPERLASTDAFKGVTEAVGSGPYRFKPDEYVAGSRTVFTKFDAYVPRQEPPSMVAGGKRANIERIEWRVIPEAGTAVNALINGEVDWIEQPLPDLLPQLKAAPAVVVDRLDPWGLYPVLRFNNIIAPTDNQKLRQAMLAAIDPVEVMQAVMGDDTANYTAPIGAFLPNTDSTNNAAMDRVGGKKSEAELRAMVKASGYNGEKLVLMHPTDQTFYNAMSQVVYQALTRIGLNVEDAAMDFGTVVQRRASKEPLDKGGWSMFCTSFPGLDYVDPLSAPALRGNGAKAWIGWPTDAKVETLRDQWVDSTDPAQRKTLCAEIQAEVFDNASFVPLGNYRQSTAWSKNLGGMLQAPLPVFWNVTKS